MYNNLLTSQLEVWEMARNNFEALKEVKTKTLQVNNCTFQVQFNPARIVSSSAKVDAKSIQERKCFLCAENRPEVQEGVLFESKNRINADKGSISPTRTEQGRSVGGSKGGSYTILINPFPIFPKHYTIPDNEHLLQLIKGRFGDMLELAETMNDSVIFDNGPRCGASAPDHIHFQAGNKGFLPVEMEWKKHKGDTVWKSSSAEIAAFNYVYPAFLIEAESIVAGNEAFERIYNILEIKEGEEEPMLNILSWYEDKKWISLIIPRSQHRPARYFAEGEEKMMISPASVDLGGVFITPVEKDFERISVEDIKEILSEICLSEEQFRTISNKLTEK